MSDIHRDRQRDAAGIGPYARDAERLVRLSDLGKWDVAEGEPDIRGWEVRTIGGRELGKVKELLVDPDAGEVVMADVVLTGSDRHALVPLRSVEIDRGRRLVRMDSSDLTPEEQEAVAEASGDESTGERSLLDRKWSDTGRVKYASRADDEKVVERRPIVEEVVVRRRVVDEAEAKASPPAETRRREDDSERLNRTD
jgi:sporulation protein YlmC with PRC-barrel domain